VQSGTRASEFKIHVAWSEDDKLFVADTPELPGRMAHGKTRAAAVRNMKDAIAFWLRVANEEGLEIRR
jgi:predicted RNase H-like HicB family nuclease